MVFTAVYIIFLGIWSQSIIYDVVPINGPTVGILYPMAVLFVTTIIGGCLYILKKPLGWIICSGLLTFILLTALAGVIFCMTSAMLTLVLTIGLILQILVFGAAIYLFFVPTMRSQFFTCADNKVGNLVSLAVGTAIVIGGLVLFPQLSRIAKPAVIVIVLGTIVLGIRWIMNINKPH